MTEYTPDASRTTVVTGYRWLLEWYPESTLLTLAFRNPANGHVRAFRNLSQADALHLAETIAKLNGKKVVDK